MLIFDLDNALLEEFLSNNSTKYKKYDITKDMHKFNTIRNMEFPSNVICVTQITNPKKIEKIEFELEI